MSEADTFLENIMVFVDRNGVVLSKSSNPMSSYLSMQYQKDNLSIQMSAYSHAQGNGSCSIEVDYGGKTVYSATGSFTSHPFGTEVSIYVPGQWEEMVKL